METMSNAVSLVLKPHEMARNGLVARQDLKVLACNHVGDSSVQGILSQGKTNIFFRRRAAAAGFGLAFKSSESILFSTEA